MVLSRAIDSISLPPITDKTITHARPSAKVHHTVHMYTTCTADIPTQLYTCACARTPSAYLIRARVYVLLVP